MKSVLISIRPKWCEKIASGEKTIEVRKTRPKPEPPFRCYIYCTRDRNKKGPKDYCGTGLELGKVIGEFTCDEIIEVHAHSVDPACFATFARMAPDEIHRYLGDKDGYGWHISGLEIYNKPRGLAWLRRPIECHRGRDRENCIGCWDCEIERPPQSWCYVAGSYT